MQEVNATVIAAMHAAAMELGSQAKLAAKIGITPAALSRYLHREVFTINTATWNMIYDAIGKYLPEEYKPAATSPAANEPFKPGDVVRLRSGGPLMTVDSIIGDKACCVWIANDKPGMASINTCCLIKQEPFCQKHHRRH